MKGEVDDWLSDLPPLDGADDEPAAEDGPQDDLLPDADEDASLDDAAADDLEVDEGVDIDDDEPSGGEEDERWEADVGEPELDLADDASDEAGDADAPGVGESDLDLDDDLPPSADDAGEEGTTDALEQSIEEELPALDADDEGDFEDALLLETGLAVPSQEGPRWSADPWERSRSGDRPIALAVPDDDAVATLAMSVAPERLVSVTVAGRLLVDGDAIDARGGRLLPASFIAGKAGPPLLALGSEGGATVLWAASRTGHVAHSADLGRSWSAPLATGRPILALAAGADRSVVVLALEGEQPVLLTLIDGQRWDAKAALADGHALPLVSTSSPWLAIASSSVAIGDASGIWIARHGESFRHLATATPPTAGVFAGKGPDAMILFAEAGADVDESARLLRATREGRLEILAELAPPEDDRTDAPAILAMAWDEMSQSLRVAFSTVVCTVTRSRIKA